MNSLSLVTPPRRRIWPWVLGLCLAPFIVLAIVAFSFLSLGRDATVLREQVMVATHSGWNTKVQLSMGRLTLGLVRAGLPFVDNKHVIDARLALNAVSRVSVGVYSRKADFRESWSHAQLCVDTDEAMRRHGWRRLVGVLDNKEAVLIYVSEKYDADGPIDICLSVVNDRELVVVAATVTADSLAELIERHAGDELRQGLKLAKF